MAVYYYMRINTKEDRSAKSRLNASFKKYAEAAGLSYEEEGVFLDENNNVDQWLRLAKALKSGDTVVFKNLWQFPYHDEDLYLEYKKLFESGIKLVFISSLLMCTDYLLNLQNESENPGLIEGIPEDNMIRLLMYVELDRLKTYQDRIKTGIDSAKKNNGGKTISGRKEKTMEKLTKELEEAIYAHLDGGKTTQIDIMKQFDVSRNTVKKYAKLLEERRQKGQM